MLHLNHAQNYEQRLPRSVRTGERLNWSSYACCGCQMCPNFAKAHLVRVNPDRHPEGARQTEVGDLDDAVAVDQQVLGLQVAV